MNNKELINILKEYKEKYSKKITIKYVDGESDTRFLSYFSTSDNLFEKGRNLMYQFENAAERGYVLGMNPDSFEYGLSLGVIYEKDTLGSKNEILASSKTLNNIIAVKPIYVYAKKDDTIVNNRDLLNKDYTYGHYIDFNSFIEQANECGFIFNGPETYEELKNTILMNEGEYSSLVLNVNEKKLVK